MALCLVVVLAMARVIVWIGHPGAFGPWLPAAMIADDLLLVGVFGVIVSVTGSRWPVRALYALLVLVTALSIPVQLVLASPVTVPMLRAARGTLSDSLWQETRPLHVGLALMVGLVGLTLPRILASSRSRGSWRAAAGWAMAVIAALLLGPVAVQHADPGGIERNSVLALLRSFSPRVAAASVTADWRASALPVDRSDDLRALSGIARGKSVVLVILEGTGAGYLRPFGAATDPMPSLTRLAAHALRFDNAYAVYPESVKGLVSTLASRYPGFDIPAASHATIATPSIASALHQHGYASALFHSGRFMYLGMDSVVDAMGFDSLFDAGAIGGNHASSFGIDETATVSRLLRWIDGVPKDQPFFTAWLPIAGHHPYPHTLPGPFSDENDAGRYRNALHESDAALADLLAGLHARHRDSTTLLVIISDHGEAFEQHPGNIGHTLALYEENLHVPIVIAGTGVPARAVHRVVSLVDVAPTVFSLLGLEVPASFQGSSLIDAAPRAALFFTDYSLGLLGLRDGCTKFIYEMESRRSRVFDLCRDPAEQHNLAVGQAAWAEQARERLKAWAAAQVGAIR